MLLTLLLHFFLLLVVEIFEIHTIKYRNKEQKLLLVFALATVRESRKRVHRFNGNGSRAVRPQTATLGQKTECRPHPDEVREQRGRRFLRFRRRGGFRS